MLNRKPLITALALAMGLAFAGLPATSEAKGKKAKTSTSKKVPNWPSKAPKK